LAICPGVIQSIKEADMNCECCHKNKSRIRLCDIEENSVVKEFNVCPDCFAVIKRMMYDSSRPLLATAEIIRQTQELLAAEQLTEETGLTVLPKPGELATVEDKPAPVSACPKCGMTLAEFKSRGRFGCAHDYELFGDQLESLLERIHDVPEARHKGRLPGQTETVARRRRLGELRARLDAAVQEENFELAARLRDQIQELDDAPAPSMKESNSE
jgi:protein-arginine kinase activator protein McsA